MTRDTPGCQGLASSFSPPVRLLSRGQRRNCGEAVNVGLPKGAAGQPSKPVMTPPIRAGDGGSSRVGVCPVRYS